MRHILHQVYASLAILTTILINTSCSSITTNTESIVAKPFFTDEKLAEHLKQNPNGIIYVYSKGMPLSLKGLGEAREIAKKHGLAFLPLLDPTSSIAYAESQSSLLVASPQLISMGATQHFPAVLFYRNGSLNGNFNPGYETPEIFETKLSAYLKSDAKLTASYASRPRAFIPRFPAANEKPKLIGFKREITLPAEPTYFIRVDSVLRKIFMSGDCVVSLDSGKCLSRGNTWEPYPVSGFNVLVIPNCQSEDGMCFYDSTTYINQERSSPIFFDPNVLGYYQSLGFLKQTAEEATIRIITYYGFMRDYLVKKGSVATAGRTKKFCENRSLLKLPMLSKDGRFISGWDDQKQKTVILNIADDGACNEVYSFNEMVSKMDWSYDGKLVAFHVSRNARGDITEGFPAELVDQQIFLMDIKTKRVQQLSSGDDLFYFPHFARNGLLYALRKKIATDVISVVELDPSEVKFE